MRPTTTHIIILIIVVLLLFGANRLPGMAKSVGQSLKIFKKEVSDLTGDKDERTAPPVADTTGTTTHTAPDPVADARPADGSDVPPPPPPAPRA